MSETIIHLRPLVSRDKMNDPPYRTVVCSSDFIDYPDHWPRYFNGGGNEPCDLLQGPCACGAWHDLGEWEIRHPN